jgi:hypothetical protein
VGPSRDVGQDLGFTASSITPEEKSRVASLEVRQRHSSNVLRSPKAIADLVIGVKHKFILVNIILLLVCRTTKEFLIKVKYNHRCVLNNFPKLLWIQLLVNHYRDHLTNYLIND